MPLAESVSASRDNCLSFCIGAQLSMVRFDDVLVMIAEHAEQELWFGC